MKNMYHQFERNMKAKTNTEDQWLWMTRSDLKIETEALECSTKKHHSYKVQNCQHKG